MKRIASIGLVAMREILHQKLLYNIAVVGVLFSLMSLALSSLTIGQIERIIVDVGLGATGIVTSLIAVLVGSGLVANDIERKSLYFILSKPVGRTQYLLGKWLGLVAVLVVNAVGLSLLTAVLLGVYAMSPPDGFLAAIAGNLFEAIILAALAIGFSAFTTPALAAVFSFAGFVLGHVIGYIDFSRYEGAGLKLIGQVARVVVPDFQLVNFRAGLIDGPPVAGAEVMHALVYAAGYTLVVLTVASAIFSQRDLK